MKIFNHLPNYRYYDAEGTDSVPFDTKYDKLRNLCIYGNSVQDGTPTPETPIEIESVGEKTKNLLGAFTPSGNASVSEYYGNGFKATATVNTGGYGNYVRIPILNSSNIIWGKTYTVSCLVEQSNANMNPFMRVTYLNNSSNSHVDFKTTNVVNNNINSVTFTLPDEQPSNFGPKEGMGYGTYEIFLFFNIQRTALDDYGTIYVTDIMVNEGEYKPYEPYGKYKIPIKCSGKNILDNKLLLATDTDNVDWDITETGIRETKIGSGGYTQNVLYDITDLVKPNAIYYLHRDIEKNYKIIASAGESISGSLRIRVDGTIIDTIYSNQTDKMIQIPSEYKTVEITTYSTPANSSIENFDESITYYFEWKNLYLSEYPYMSYEPYQEPKTYNIFLDEPLRKAGDYADCIDFKSGKLVRNIGVEIVSFSLYSFNASNGQLYLRKNISSMLPNSLDCISNKIKTFKTFPGSADKSALMVTGTGLYYFVIAEESEQQTYIDLLADTEIYFVLKTPIETEIDLPDIDLHKGTNIISVGTTTASSKIEVQYLN